MNLTKEVYAKIKKDDKGGFIVRQVYDKKPGQKEQQNIIVEQDALTKFDNFINQIA